MKYVTLPGTDLRVSSISLGTAVLGSAVDRGSSFALLDAFVQAGGTLIDTARVYADWLGGERSLSEKTIGAWLRAVGLRDQVVIVTKGGHPEMATPLKPRLAPDEIVGDLDASLACLGIEQIDLYYLHRDDPSRPVDAIMETLDAQVRLGKIRHAACSNWQPARVQAAQDYARSHGLHLFVASQIFWSLAVANPGAFPADYALMDEAAQAFYERAGLAVVAFTSQAHGFFTRAAAGGLESLKPDRRQHFENPTNLGRLERAQVLAQRLGVSVSAIVLAYITSHPFVGIPVIGPRSQEQLHDSLADAELTLTPEQLRYLVDGQERDAA
jgi:aryl-alcohol dehydrogenase-like predicted oxidoreductase